MPTPHLLTLLTALLFVALIAFLAAFVAAIRFYYRWKDAEFFGNTERQRADVWVEHYRKMQQHCEQLARVNRMLREQVRLMADDGEWWKLGRRQEDEN